MAAPTEIPPPGPSLVAAASAVKLPPLPRGGTIDSIFNTFKVLEGGPWTMDNRPFVLKRWSPSVRMEQERLTSIPIWVKFPNLPLHFWSKECLGKIASTVGTPLFMDTATQMATRISYARVCVEVSAEAVLPDVVLIETMAGGKETFPIAYDWKPQACSHCHTFGHDDALCCKRSRLNPLTQRTQESEGFSSQGVGVQSKNSPLVRSPKKVTPKVPTEVKSPQVSNKFSPLMEAEEDNDDATNPQQLGELQVAVVGEAVPSGQEEVLDPKSNKQLGNFASALFLPGSWAIDETGLEGLVPLVSREMVSLEVPDAPRDDLIICEQAVVIQAQSNNLADGQRVLIERVSQQEVDAHGRGKARPEKLRNVKEEARKKPQNNTFLGGEEETLKSISSHL
ncbi:hypothetical protein QJS10_CPA07g00448 [Acorus calamus]|uniref:DUF4283 domain-containing protein n=1 Tax=Acorus calamus TaxID=4465 RepID=A0AAV9EHJ1_ACOCL|nr:hypothetical protein QJS10_CPA07g00448 [Acorus calamus]